MNKPTTQRQQELRQDWHDCRIRGCNYRRGEPKRVRLVKKQLRKAVRREAKLSVLAD